MRLCKIYSLSDAHDGDPLWQELLQAMSPGWQSLGALHRKYWEWGLGLYGLHKLGCIKPDALALGVGAGVEWPLFYLANRVQRVHAIDLYSQESHFNNLDPTVAEHAEKLAPFPYRRESLVFQKMNALDLQFEDNTFDFVFSFSSIEHFGGHVGAVLAMQEIARVLKPGGVAAIATEVILSGPRHDEFFKPHEIEPCFLDGSGMEFVEPLDLSIDPELIEKPVLFEVPEGFQRYTGPHTSVRCGEFTFTSIEFFLRKPLGWRPASLVQRLRLRSRLRAFHSQGRARQLAGRYLPRIVRRAVKRLLNLRAASS